MQGIDTSVLFTDTDQTNLSNDIGSDNLYRKRKYNPVKIGDSFSTSNGDCVVFSYGGAHEVQVVFVETLTVDIFQAGSLRAGSVKDPNVLSTCGVGYLGEGPHEYTVKGVITATGRKWLDMMHRCYGSNVPKSYTETTVASEFRSYQNFADWFECQSNNNSPDLDLDKDLRPFLRGEDQAKQYSANNCALIPALVNLKLSHLQKRLTQLAKAQSVHPSHAILPVGISFDRTHENFRVYVGSSLVGSRRRLGAALQLYEQKNIEAFIALLDQHSNLLTADVLDELVAYKRKFLAKFSPEINKLEPAH